MNKSFEYFCMDFSSPIKMEEDKDSNENPADEVLKQIDMLQLTLIDFGEDENLTRNKLKITEEQHTKSLMGLQDLLAKKDQKIKFLEEKNFHLEEDAMRIKLRQEDLKKNFTRELERRCCQIKIYEKEAELSKEQLRQKVIKMMKMESKIGEMESQYFGKNKEHDKKLDRMDAKFKHELEELKSKLENVKEILSHLESTKKHVDEVNHNLLLQLDKEKNSNQGLEMELDDLNAKNKALILELEKIKSEL